MSGDKVVIEDNIITGNNTGGIIVTSGDFVTEVASDKDSDPHSDQVEIRNNVMFDNGNDPDGEMKLLMLSKFSTKGRTSWRIKVPPRRSVEVVSPGARPTDRTGLRNGQTAMRQLCEQPMRLPLPLILAPHDSSPQKCWRHRPILESSPPMPAAPKWYTTGFAPAAMPTTYD